MQTNDFRFFGFVLSLCPGTVSLVCCSLVFVLNRTVTLGRTVSVGLAMLAMLAMLAYNMRTDQMEPFGRLGFQLIKLSYMMSVNTVRFNTIISAIIICIYHVQFDD